MNEALGIVVRTSVLLLCVSVLALALKRASASVRHALWVVGLLAVLMFPVASSLLPKWDWAILPEEVPTSKGFDTTPSPAVAPDVRPVLAVADTQLSPVSSRMPIAAPTQPTRAAAWSWSQLLVLAWALGSLVFVFGWMKSLWELRQLTHRSRLLTEDGWTERLTEVQREIGVPGTIQLRVGTDKFPPMTWGISRHVILMPAAALDWSAERQRLVLAHEMAHVKRNDGIGQVLAQAVCSIYWFNPLVWHAVRRLHAERERACDDCVLRLGADGADYADHLLQITRGLNGGLSQAAVSMAHPSQLKARMIAILDSKMKRSRASRIVASTLLTTIGVLTLSIAAIQVTSISTLVLPAFAAPLRASFSSLTAPVEEQQQVVAPVTSQQEFINQYCVSCHNNTDQYASLALDNAATDIAHVANNRQLWEKVVRRLRAGMDPPPFSRIARPSAAAINSTIQYLETELDRSAKTYVPQIVPHRLNRTEYTNAIQDLLDLEIDSKKLLPDDDWSSSFDVIASTLDYNPRAAAAYVTIAPIVSRLAIQSAPTSLSYQRVFVCLPPAIYGVRNDPACARQIVTNLAAHAFRGQATTADIDSSMATFNAAPYGFELKVEAVLDQILANPKFLYRTEDGPAGVKPGEAFRINDLALASRLSYFLWSTGPDQELIEVAKQGKLHDPAVLEQQTLRMLKDYRADALSTNFAEEWFAVRGLQRIAPSPMLFPEFDEALRQAMGKEMELFFNSIVREDRNVVDLLTADYTFVNNRLARLYGLPNVTGSQFRRITLGSAFDVRRGILGKSGLLTVYNNFGSNTRTSPAGRAKLMMNVLLGVSPPDPPPNVPPLKEPNATNLGMRAAMDLHKTAGNSCSECHSLIDPIGNALENFNAIGAWRDVDGGAPVNAADTLYDGTKVNGPVDLRRWLVGHSDQFVQVLTQKLMTYALGRGVVYQDMPLIRAVDREAARNNNRFSAIVLGIVKSDTFQMNSK